MRSWKMQPQCHWTYVAPMVALEVCRTVRTVVAVYANVAVVVFVAVLLGVIDIIFGPFFWASALFNLFAHLRMSG